MMVQEDNKEDRSWKANDSIAGRRSKAH